MPGLRKQSAVRLISWEELETMVRSLGTMIMARERPSSITYRSEDDAIPAFMLAKFLNVSVNGSGKLFSVNDDLMPDYSFFAKKYQSSFYNKNTKFYLEELEVTENGDVQQIRFPWDKL